MRVRCTIQHALCGYLLTGLLFIHAFSQIQQLIARIVAVFHVPYERAVFSIPHSAAHSSEFEACIFHLKSLAGLYLRAFLQGIEQIMDSYRDAIVSIETAALLQPHFAFPLVKVIDALNQVKLRTVNIYLTC
jgi:hypothetical protein